MIRLRMTELLMYECNGEICPRLKVSVFETVGCWCPLHDYRIVMNMDERVTPATR